MSLTITGMISIIRAYLLSTLIEDNAKKHIVRSPIRFPSDRSQIQIQISIKRSTILRVYSLKFS